MDKNAIKKYAVWARRELIERVSQRAMIYGITAKDVGDPNAESVSGHLLSRAEKRQRIALIRNIKEKGYEQVMEEVAYTWFNRFAALRFMEVNGYLPSHIRVFTNDTGEFKPQILAEAIHLELEGLDMNKVYELESSNRSEDLFKYLLIVQCNALNSILPGMFQRIEDYTELLLPDYLLREGSVIEQMVTTIPEEDWTDQVQIIGWLYQYYNTEPKDKVFAGLKKNIKITKGNIPAATQLFTPDWIVHYMVENSLGRLWLEGHPNDVLKSEWKYYLDEAEQEPEVQAQLAAIREEYATLKPDEIHVIDPCMGSGHILCVLFDVLVRIYEDYGYTAREAAVKIVENNLWGLDIDERAAQLSYFAVMMKARQYDRRFFTWKVQPHVYSIEESNGITSVTMHDMGLNLLQEEYEIAARQAMRLIEEMHDAKEYGSIINVTPCDWNLLRRFAEPREEEGQLQLDIHGEIKASVKLNKLINIGEALAQKYDVVVTNPPYMGQKGLNDKLNTFLRQNYFDHKFDLFAVFTDRCMKMLTPLGFVGMMTPNVWMFITSYKKIREEILSLKTLINLVKMSDTGFADAAVSICAFVVQGQYYRDYIASYVRLNSYNGSDLQELGYLQAKNEKRIDLLFHRSATSFKLIDDWPLTFWAGKRTKQCFVEYPALSTFASPKQGMATMDTDKYLKMWHEVPIRHINFGARSAKEAKESGKRWFPIHKGGSPRKWFGNNYFVVNWFNDGKELKDNAAAIYGSYSKRIYNTQYFFLEGATWSAIGYDFAIRYFPQGFTFSNAGMALFAEHKLLLYIVALLNSKLSCNFLSAINESVNFNQGDIAKIPVCIDDCVREDIVSKTTIAIKCSKEDWDSFETSWDFTEHPFIAAARITAQKGKLLSIKQAFEDWMVISEKRFQILKNTEEELNRIFIDIYGLNEELNPEIENRDITVCRANLQREVRSFISYAIGCIFGRYSLNYRGLIYAGGEWDATKYFDFLPDRDAVIPICDDEYFEDDIVGWFVRFVEVVFGKALLEENLCFIANALGGKGSSREVIRNYFINDFYKDHCKVYQKRPIYWLFDSGKKNGFKCLIYMHRYQPDTIARIRTDYVHEQQSRYRTVIADLEQRLSSASTSNRVKLNKRLAKLQEQAEEIRVYEEKIHHLADQMISIDLDDGVKHNYAIFKDVLAKIK